jgi:hypothetical protein
MADMVDIAKSMTSRKFNPMPSMALRSFKLSGQRKAQVGFSKLTDSHLPIP